MKNLKRWLPLIILAGLMAAAFASGLHKLVSLEAIKENKELLFGYVQDYPILSVFGFIGVYTTFVALSLPAATILTLLGGFLFGKWLGTLYVVIAATLGATTVFLIAKSSVGKSLREKAGGLYKRIEGNMQDNAGGYLMFLRLVPLFPFFLVNIVAAMFNVNLRTYVVTTFFGIIPGSFVFVNVGQTLAEIDNLKDVVSTEVLLSFGLLGLFALIPNIYKSIKAKRAAAVVLMSLSMAVPQAQADGHSHYDAFLVGYTSLLSAHVSAEERDEVTFNAVDYTAVEGDATYQSALEHLKQVDPTAFTGDEKKAFWMNAYNFLTIDLIVSEKPKKSIRELGSVLKNTWKKYSWDINGEKYTLDQIEHKILRPMGDARIHFAINCASLSCPDLRSEPYLVDRLEAQLAEQTTLSLKDSTKVLRRDGDAVYISKIFDWFKADFNDGDVKAWLQENADVAKGTKIKYLDYNWGLNRK